MAINVDTVYQRVLAVANKEQRGFITPLEFNLLANQAQMEIFEQYFYDLKQFGEQHGNDTVHADMLNILQEKIAEFEVHNAAVTSGTTLPTNLYRISSVYHIASSIQYMADRLTRKEFEEYRHSPLPMVTIQRPIYLLESGNIEVYTSIDGGTPSNLTSDVYVNYIKQPDTVYWGYVIVPSSQNGNEFPLNNPSTSTNFELHPSEETKLVYKILELAGFMIKAPDLAQAANVKQSQTIQQQKQ
mgnify:CR=1 FL=1